MKLVSYLFKEEEKLGLFYQDKIFNLKDSAAELNLKLPSKIKKFLKGEESSFKIAEQVFEEIKRGTIKPGLKKNDVKFLSPVPHPSSLRDGYAFRQHVETARRNRGAEMIPEFDQFPVFYFSNHNAVFGEGEIAVEPDHLEKLDFELEAAAVVGKRGKNISAGEADSYIAGYTIMNDLSARVLQMEEMKLNLGPAKGKDFATVIGPYLVTPDELEQYKIETSSGNKYDLEMKALHNGKIISEGNLKDMNWTFAEIIERASYGVELLPGDIIGSGTAGTGCYLELNGTGKREADKRGENYTPVWLQAGDEIELEITGLGRLKTKIVKAAGNYSILAKKKNKAYAAL